MSSIVTLTEKIRFIQSVFGAGKLSRGSTNIDIWCPFCAPSDHGKKKLSIRLSDDANHCWTCDWKARTLAPLIKKHGSREDFLAYCQKFNVSTKINVDECVSKPRLPDDFKLINNASLRDPDVNAVRNHLKFVRNMSDDDVWYYKIGVSDQPRWRRRAIVPSFDANGELNYYVARAVDAQRIPRYDNPDAEKKDIIFNELNIDWKSRLTLVEGVFDMVKSNNNTVPLLGSTLNEESLLFNRIISNNTPVAIALDPDMRLTKMPKLMKKLKEYDIDTYVVDVRPYEDPGKMTKEQFQSCLDTAKRMSWKDTYMIKLESSFRTRLTI